MSNDIGEITLNKFCEIEQHHEIEWTIKDFFSYTKKKERYYSPDFNASDTECYFVIYPNGEHRENSVGWVGLYLNLPVVNSIALHDCTPRKSAIFSFGLKKVDGAVEVIQEEKSFDFKQDKCWCGEAKFLNRAKLTKRRSVLAPSGALIVICTLRVDERLSFASRLVDLSSDFRRLFTSKTGSDATLKVQNEEFPVHKNILASRSPVFEVMFNVDMKEKNTGVVDIDDCHPGSFRDFLVFIYSGRLENSSGNIFELYRIAHKYCMDQLKDVCVLYIMGHLSIRNVIDAVVLGHQFDESELKSKSHEFFEDNVASIFKTDEWKSLSRKDPTLANELLINMTEHMDISRKEEE